MYVCLHDSRPHFYLTWLIVDNPVNHFPTYEPTEERKAEIQAQLEEEDNPLNLHYDASREVRAKGAGFYQFSGDEETRQKQMEELKQARVETEKTRAEAGAIDLRPGEVEGLRGGEGDDGAAGPSTTKSRAAEKRKREIEERRRLLEAKRRKKDPSSGPVDQDTTSKPVKATIPVSSNDPFALLEAQAASAPKSKAVGGSKQTSDADAFLAGLERDILHGKRS